MKKLLVILLLLSIFSSIIVLADDPPVGGAAADKEKFDKAAGNIPINSDGSFNGSILNPIKSKAEMRIDVINKWLEDNAPWLSIFFGITPAISWLFAVNFYFMLLFMVVLVLNSKNLFVSLSPGKGKIAGLILYIVLLVTKVYVKIAENILRLIEAAWELSKIVSILIAIAFILILVFSPKALNVIGKFFRKDKGQEEIDRLADIRHQEEAYSRATHEG